MRRASVMLCVAFSPLAALVPPAVHADVALAHAAGYHAGGGPLGGGHPTAGAYSFTVPEGKDRLLLVLGPARYDPAIPTSVSSQRATLRRLTYGGRELTPMPRPMAAQGRHGAAHLWYLVNPPTGTHRFEMIQFRKDNGGENRMAALVFTGVDRAGPFTGPVLAFVSERGKTIRYEVNSRKGGMVVDSVHYGGRRHVYYRIMPAADQTLVWENCHDYRYEWMGSVKPGADSVEMRWELAGKTSCEVLAVSLNPSKGGGARASVAPLQALPEDKHDAEKPGLVATLYDLSADPPAPSTPRYNYKTPALGAKIPLAYRTQPHTRRVIENVDFHPNKYRANPGRLPDEKGLLDSGLRKNFVLECTGRIRIPESGSILFKLLSVDQAKLWIDGRLVVDNHGHNHNTLKTGTIRLAAGRHAFRLVHVEDVRGFGVSLGWRLPGGHPHGIPRGHKAPINLIPASAFTHTDADRK